MSTRRKIEGPSAVDALRQAGSVAKAAELIGVPRTTFYSRITNEIMAGGTNIAQGNYLIEQNRQLVKGRNAALEQARVAAELYAEVARMKPSKYKPSKKRKARKQLGAKHLMIPDPQQKEGVPVDHLVWAGEYAVEKQPDTVIVIGDWWDMPSLSSYDRGKLQFEGRRYRADIEAGKAAMELFLAPIRRAKGYRPRIVFTLGNHENRVTRTVEEDARLEGTIGTKDFQLEAMGLEVHPFLKTVVIDGVTYCHYFPRSASGSIAQNKRGAPNARAQLIREGGSCVAGHMQGLDIACLPLRGRLQFGIIAGSFYQHEEDFLTPQGTAYWRGIVMLHEVSDGNVNPMLVSLDYLRSRYA